MKLTVEGNLSTYNAQTLCMIFFPGARFAGNDDDPDAPEVHISVAEEPEGVRARAAITADKKTEKFEHFEPYNPDVCNASMTLKLAAGKAMLGAGKKLLGVTPSWGILTGVRPTKIASGLLAAGKSERFVRSALTGEYFLSPKKAALLTSTAQNEARAVPSDRLRTCSLYLSIPFCPTRCTYCSFVSYSTPRLLSLIPDYLRRLREDTASILRLIRELGLRLNTVYIGGGTPTILTCDQLRSLFEVIAEGADTDAIDEYTLEAGRPDTVTPEKLSLAAEYGVTRVSINPQTLEDEVLRTIGRKHTAEDFYRAFSVARESGIHCINTDLIAGLPGERFPGFSTSLDRILELRPENLTVHSFSVKRSSELARCEGIYSRNSRDASKCVDYSQLRAKTEGYRPYYLYRQKNTVGNLENVGFSLEGYEGLYNIYIMEELHTVFAAGAGSVTKLVSADRRTIERIFMPKYPYEYLDPARTPPHESGFCDRIRRFYSDSYAPLS